MVRRITITARNAQGRKNWIPSSECVSARTVGRSFPEVRAQDAARTAPTGHRGRRTGCIKKMGTKRRIGSIDRCEICGAEYTVTSGRQKYCSDACQREAVLKWQRDHKKGYSRKSGQDVSKKERRTEAKKICVYCLREFVSDKPTNLCSDYCRSEQRKLNQCAADIKRGKKRNIKKYEKKRSEYREKCRME